MRNVSLRISYPWNVNNFYQRKFKRDFYLLFIIIIIIIIIIITYLLTYLLQLGFHPVAVVLH